MSPNNRRRFLRSGLCVTTGLVAVSTGFAVAQAQTTGFIVLYEGNNGTQDIVNTYTDEGGQNRRVKPNDEARSLKLFNVRPGAVIIVYDDKNGSTRDDFCIIQVLQSSFDYTVGTFHHSYEDAFVRVSAAYRNGLDGKVSRIRID